MKVNYSFGSYYGKLSTYAFRDIHQLILESSNKSEAAKRLGANDRTLESYLSRITYNDLPLTYKRLQKISPDELRAAHWGKNL